MKLNQTRTIKFKPIYLFVGAVIVILIVIQLLQWLNTGDLRKENKRLEIENKKILQEIEKRAILRRQDSIQIIQTSKKIKETDSINRILQVKIDYFKNQSYLNYKKYLDVQKSNYNSASDDDKSGILSDLAKER